MWTRAMGHSNVGKNPAIIAVNPDFSNRVDKRLISFILQKTFNNISGFIEIFVVWPWVACIALPYALSPTIASGELHQSRKADIILLS